MASVYTVLSASDTIIAALPPPNAVKAAVRNSFTNYQLCAYPNSSYSSFGAFATSTQALEIPGGSLFYALMPYTNGAVTQYAITDILTQGWSVPNLGGGTVGSPGQAFDQPSLAAALSAIGGLLMISNGTVING